MTNVDTSKIGYASYTVTAVDKAGNTTVETVELHGQLDRRHRQRGATVAPRCR